MPTAAPDDADTEALIIRTASEVLRLGPEHEGELLRKDGGANKTYSFLQNGEHALFYRWKMHCLMNNYPSSATQIVSVLAVRYNSVFVSCIIF